VIEFEISSARVGHEGWIVSITGEIDMYTAPELEREFERALEEERHDVVLDLCATSFIDSTVLGVVLAAARRFEARGGSLVLVTDDRRILRVLEITAVDHQLTIEPSLTRALDRVAVADRP
jgi:anti-sigma B factor antagonist